MPGAGVFASGAQHQEVSVTVHGIQQTWEKHGKNMGVEPKIGGKPPKWMVYNGKPKPYKQMG